MSEEKFEWRPRLIKDEPPPYGETVLLTFPGSGKWHNVFIKDHAHLTEYTRSGWTHWHPMPPKPPKPKTKFEVWWDGLPEYNWDGSMKIVGRVRIHETTAKAIWCRCKKAYGIKEDE